MDLQRTNEIHIYDFSILFDSLDFAFNKSLFDSRYF